MKKVLFLTATGQIDANMRCVRYLLDIDGHTSVEDKQTDITDIVVITTIFTEKSGDVDKLLKALASDIQTVSIKMLSLPDGIEESNLVKIKQCIYTWLEQNKVDKAIFNVTGGTKLISIAQDQIAQESSQRFVCLYQSRNNHEIVWYNQSQESHDTAYRSVMSLNDDAYRYLSDHGFITDASLLDTVLNNRSSVFIQKMKKLLEDNFDKTTSIVSTLNFICSSTKDNNYDALKFPFTASLTLKDKDRQKNILSLLASIPNTYFSLRHKQGDDYELLVNNQKDFNFIKGIWFEMLIGDLIQSFFSNSKAAQKIEILHSLKFKQQSDGNEIDIAFMLDGNLHLFECKTRKWQSQRSKGIQQANTAIHKLNSVTNDANLGLNVYRYFVSLFELAEESKRVAKEQGIILIDGKKILAIENHLQIDAKYFLVIK